MKIFAKPLIAFRKKIDIKNSELDTDRGFSEKLIIGITFKMYIYAI